MDMAKICAWARKPQPYEKGTAVMWTDEYISRQLLEIHLNPDTNAASRNRQTIGSTVGWIQKAIGRDSGAVLDLGCGPGLYTTQLAQVGYKVTGVDFSRNSIAYAQEQAARNGLAIDYFCQDYLDLEYQDRFDAILMIYCDFGVLSIADRELLLNKIHRALKPQGVFLFDALNEAVLGRLKFEKTWTAEESGFWLDKPYACLRETFHYPEQKATLDQYIVIDEDSQQKLYRFWNHYFSGEELREICAKAGFSQTESCENLIGEQGLYNGNDVTFYKAMK